MSNDEKEIMEKILWFTKEVASLRAERDYLLGEVKWLRSVVGEKANKPDA